MIRIIGRPNDGGGGSEFLRKLVDCLQSQGYYSDSDFRAKIILINSHHWLGIDIIKIVYHLLMGSVIVIRLDGPLAGYRNGNDARLLDSLINWVAYSIADGVVYQSHWHKNEMIRTCARLDNICSCIIMNGITWRLSYHKRDIDLLYAANSDNDKKGRADIEQLILQYPESFANKQFFLVGPDFKSRKYPVECSAFQFSNTVDREKLSNLMSRSSLFIHSSRRESCSNVLLEAIGHGCIPIVYKGSSNTEVVQDVSLQYQSIEELYTCVMSKLAGSFSAYNFSYLKEMNAVANDYKSFLCSIAPSNEILKRISSALLFFSASALVLISLRFRLVVKFKLINPVDHIYKAIGQFFFSQLLP